MMMISNLHANGDAALAILGCEPDVRMFLHKPIYGQLDAPRRWFLEASRRLLGLGFRVPS